MLIIIGSRKTTGSMQGGLRSLVRPTFAATLASSTGCGRPRIGVSGRLKRLLADEPLLTCWEQVTGAEFPGDRFEAVLCADIFRGVWAGDNAGKQHLCWAHENLAKHCSILGLHGDLEYDVRDDVRTSLPDNCCMLP